VGITFSRISSSYWIDNLGFLLREKLAAIFITPCSWGLQLAGHLLHTIKLSHIIITMPLTSFFWRRCRGGRRLLQGEFCTHILYFVLSFALLYFYLHCFIKNPTKLVSFVVVYYV
jgi:hypothetical protein